MKNKFLSKVFLWMFVGLLITFLTGIYVSNNENILINIFTGYRYLIIVLLELFLVIFLSARVMKFKPVTAKILFMLYSFVSGLTFSAIFLVYNVPSIIYVFLASAFLFLIFSLIGYFTKLDLSRISTYLFMGLFALVICYFINVFLNNSTFDFILAIIGVFIFIGITAYDVQKINRLQESGLPAENLQIYGALQLYLDFINIFLDLLRIFGKNRN